MEIKTLDEAFEHFNKSEYARTIFRGDIRPVTMTIQSVWLRESEHWQVSVVSGGYHQTFTIDQFGNILLAEMKEAERLT